MDGVFAEDGDGGLKLVADWNALYRDNADPWDQSGKNGDIASYYALSRHRLSHALQRHVRAPTGGLEIGCGHGVVLSHLAVYNSNIRWEGMDISAVAIEQARQRRPKFTYHVGNLIEGGRSERKYGVVIINQMLWYVLRELSCAISNAVDMTEVGGLLVISQAFLRGEQKYGADIVDGFHGLLDYMRVHHANDLRLIEACYDDRGQHLHHDGLLVLRRIG